MLEEPPERPTHPGPFKFNHVLHLLLTVLTMGLWIIVWALLYWHMHDRHKRRMETYAQAHRVWVGEFTRWAAEYHKVHGVPAPFSIA